MDTEKRYSEIKQRISAIHKQIEKQGKEIDLFLKIVRGAVLYFAVPVLVLSILATIAKALWR